MIVETLQVGPLQCNCTILGCERTREALVIDPGDEPDRLIARLRQLDLRPRYLVHTHAHFDHIGGTRGVKEALQGERQPLASAASLTDGDSRGIGTIESPLVPIILLHPGDRWMYDNLALQGNLFGFQFEPPLPVDRDLEDEQELVFGDHKVTVIHTPGHSPGSVCYRLESGDRATVYTGDTLFAQSIGRTDLWGGDYAQIIASIKARLLPLDPDTTVWPGHGPATSIGVEKKTNPFLS